MQCTRGKLRQIQFLSESRQGDVPCYNHSQRLFSVEQDASKIFLQVWGWSRERGMTNSDTPRVDLQSSVCREPAQILSQPWLPNL